MNERQSFEIRALAERIGGEVRGDGSVRVYGLSSLAEAGPEELSLYVDPRYRKELEATRAGALVTREALPGVHVPQIVHPDPFVALIALVGLFFPPAREPAGVHPLAFVAPSASVDSTASVLPLAHVGEGVTVGPRTVVHPGAYLGRGVSLGADCVLWPNVVVREGVSIGDRVILHPGAVLGADGFGFARQDGRFLKIRHVGTIEVEDDVEIGANATIDRGTLGRTLIRRGVKIDNLVHIAHNVRVGEDSAIAAQTGVSGSTVIGKRVLMGGQVGLVDHLTIGDDAVLVAQSGVIGDIGPGEMVSGYPARSHREVLKAAAELRSLSRTRAKLRELEREVRALREAISARDDDRR